MVEFVEYLLNSGESLFGDITSSEESVVEVPSIPKPPNLKIPGTTPLHLLLLLLSTPASVLKARLGILKPPMPLSLFFGVEDVDDEDE